MSIARINIYYLDDVDITNLFRKTCEVIPAVLGVGEWHSRRYRSFGRGYKFIDLNPVEFPDLLASIESYSKSVLEYSVYSNFNCQRRVHRRTEEGNIELVVRAASNAIVNSAGPNSRYFSYTASIEIEPVEPFFREQINGASNEISEEVQENNKLLVNLILTLAENLNPSIIKVFHEECNENIMNSHFTYYDCFEILKNDIDVFYFQLSEQEASRYCIDISTSEANKYDMHTLRTPDQREELFEFLKKNFNKLKSVDISTIERYFSAKQFPYYKLNKGFAITGNTSCFMSYLVSEFYMNLIEYGDC